MKKKLGLLAYQFARWCGISALLIPKDDVYGEALRLCLEAEGMYVTGQSGEYKRGQVYAKLIKKYPRTRKRELALAIEMAMVGV